jgi:APA family basic amino acid/polyamine antiporter
VILVMLMGQSRVFFSMSRDGLIPKFFSRVNPKTQTPISNNLFFLVFVSLFAAFVPAHVVGEMTSIGTLFAFILVCVGVLIMRKYMKDAPRGFRVPFVPLVPILGIGVCFFMMVFLPFDTWIRLIVWMIIGLDVYLFYGMKRSHLNAGKVDAKAIQIVGMSGIVLTVILIGVTLAHHFTSDVPDFGLYYFSMTFAIVHLILFIWKRFQKTKTVS